VPGAVVVVGRAELLTTGESGICAAGFEETAGAAMGEDCKAATGKEIELTEEGSS